MPSRRPARCAHPRRLVRRRDRRRAFARNCAKVRRREASLRARRRGIAARGAGRGAGGGADCIGSIAHDPAAREWRQYGHQAAEQGARLLLPVFVDGALFSVGDAHFAQGDGEACGTAIEMSGSILVRFSCTKGRPSAAASASRAFPAMTIISRPSLPLRSGFSLRRGCRSAPMARMRAKTQH